MPRVEVNVPTNFLVLADDDPSLGGSVPDARVTPETMWRKKRFATKVARLPTPSFIGGNRRLSISHSQLGFERNLITTGTKVSGLTLLRGLRWRRESDCRAAATGLYFIVNVILLEVSLGVLPPP